ncbi:MAG: hypothetical protein K9H64_10220 [Bacteroidales bacterium]|nr:hypothetical protein [Bacteroidales bacterium]MCF8456243.1 hypothetical protein [Bacteroidales bacterium]
MRLFKIKLDYQKYIEFYADRVNFIRGKFEKEVFELNPNVDLKRLKEDSVIYALWIFSMALDTNQQRDDLHSFVLKKYCEQEVIDSFYSKSHIYYPKLTEAYNLCKRDESKDQKVGNFLYDLFVLQDKNSDVNTFNLYGGGILEVPSFFVFFRFFTRSLEHVIDSNNVIKKKCKLIF